MLSFGTSLLPVNALNANSLKMSLGANENIACYEMNHCTFLNKLHGRLVEEIYVNLGLFSSHDLLPHDQLLLLHFLDFLLGQHALSGP